METTPQSGFAPERILVVRLGAMGDIVHTLPAVAALRCALPRAQIGWAVEERWSELLCARGAPRCGPCSPSRPQVDAVHVVNTLAWRKALFARETRREVLEVVREIRAVHYEVAVDFQGAMKSSLLAHWSATPVRLGFTHPREAVARLFYTRLVDARGKHITEQNLSLAAALVNSQAQTGADAPQFPLPQDPAAEAWRDGEFRGAYAIINPGAGWGAKCWPIERYAELARALADEGLAVIANLGPQEEELGRALQTQSGGAVWPIVCSVGQLIALCRRARLAVGGDTGPLHLAAALGVPVVGIYGPTDPARNGPVGSPRIVLRDPASQTSHRRLAAPEAGLLSITSDEVIAAARTLLQEGTR